MFVRGTALALIILSGAQFLWALFESSSLLVIDGEALFEVQFVLLVNFALTLIVAGRVMGWW